MSTPEFILSLRKKIGHDQLWLPGIGVVIFRNDGRILLGRRSDTGKWSVISGIPEPGEHPGQAARRECLEETGLEVDLLGICMVRAEEPMVFPNGDQCVFMDICFVAQIDESLADNARVNDDESLEVGWFDPDNLPSPLTQTAPSRITAAREWLISPAHPVRFH
ncbi:NUDIX hydrolase [Actinomyces vulturis]|uniref:NUDIX hydrolase n=1 Tax=Actinomyces vulturis TaxID=1857645 RepID=UPI00082C3329|nr:NUDIX domain-containing protein [Actinomyces vulturis]